MREIERHEVLEEEGIVIGYEDAHKVAPNKWRIGYVEIDEKKVAYIVSPVNIPLAKFLVTFWEDVPFAG